MRSRAAASTTSSDGGGGVKGWRAKETCFDSPSRMSSRLSLVPGLPASSSCISQSGIRRVERSFILATMSPGLIPASPAGAPFSTATT